MTFGPSLHAFGLSALLQARGDAFAHQLQGEKIHFFSKKKFQIFSSLSSCPHPPPLLSTTTMGAAALTTSSPIPALTLLTLSTSAFFCVDAFVFSIAPPTSFPYVRARFLKQ